MVNFTPVGNKANFAQLEQNILEFWRDKDIFKNSLEARQGRPRFVFYEGPPTANGNPGLHHVLARVCKDLFLRYKTMQGFYVPRKAGWDTHGLPVEVQVEKKLGFKGKEDIEKFGIAEFNKLCRQSVWEYVQEWERLTERIGFWADFQNAYITYDNSYIETCWWILKSLWERDLLFQDYKVTMHCPRCNTSLADAEVAQGYKDNISDPSLYCRFRLSNEEIKRLPFSGISKLGLPVSFLVWTTTPWSLPANVAVALKSDALYWLVRPNEQQEVYIVAKTLATNLFGEGNFEVLGEAPGHLLSGFHYEPLYKGVDATGQPPDTAKLYFSIVDETVNIDEGTGLLHIAPAYGDLAAGRRAGLPTLFAVDLSGRILDAFPDFKGQFFKQADPAIIQSLKERGLVWRSERILHSYPFCWRCDTPLLFFAKESWYIRTTSVKKELITNNLKINWYPGHVRQGRFGNWLENNVDWALSRERYWGTPLPLWQCDKTLKIECIGSIAELELRIGKSLKGSDLHRPYVDNLTYPSPFQDGGTMHRLPLVIDCWFDSGAVPYAQVHYPFEQAANFEQDWFPADFICEGVDQTRGWFYTLHTLGTLLKNQPAYKNVVCLGHVLDGNGQKMSKSRGNIINPWDILNVQGADALRWYMFTANPPGEPRRFSQELVNESAGRSLLTLWNTYSFFVTYANIDKPDLDNPIAINERPLMDRWLIARLHSLIQQITEGLNRYEITSPARSIENFIEELSNWYLRRNRRRFWKDETDTDKLSAYQTLYTTLVTLSQLAAPFIPFLAELMYQNLVRNLNPEVTLSIHMADWPVADPALIDEPLLKEVTLIIKLVGLGRAARNAAKLKIRQPLSELFIRVREPNEREVIERFSEQLLEELNVKKLSLIETTTNLITYQAKPNLKLLGPKFGKRLVEIQRALSEVGSEKLSQTILVGQPLELMLMDNLSITLDSNEVLLETRHLPGYSIVEDGGYMAGLDTLVTPELKREGVLRDMIRLIQAGRKEAGFEITDKIEVYYQVKVGTPTELLQVLSDPAALANIQAETLSTVLHQKPGENLKTFYKEVEWDAALLELGLVKY